MKTALALAALCALCLGIALGCAAKGKPITGSLEEMYPQWQDASGLDAHTDAGKKIFVELQHSSKMACVNCHSLDAEDTLTSDGDGLVRPGASLWGAIHRTNIKNRGGAIAALGGNHCVEHWQGGPSGGLTAQQLSDLDGLLHTGASADHPTARNLDYAAMTFTVPENLEGGDAARGAPLVVKYCVSCHDVGEQPRKFGTVKPVLKPASWPTAKLRRLANRIKDSDYEDTGRDNKFMPGFSDQRMPAQDLLDVLAWFEKK